MTVHDLTSLQKTVHTCVQDIRTAVNTANRIFNTAAAKCATETEKEQIRQDTGDIITTLRQAEQVAQKYAALLDEVSHNTEIPWPPFPQQTKK